MKLQDVILRAIAKKITWVDAAEIAGLSPLTIGRMRQKYEAFGYDGLYDQARHKRRVHRVPLGTAETVLALYQQTYSGFTVRRFHQKLKAEHSIGLPYSWVRQALLGAGLVTIAKKAEPPAPVKLRERPRRRVLHFVRSASFR
ncbi:MAG: hypothetical protein LAP40_11525 [Acidobacteriia bacterium]|nr:hypothetical protein [Terriglobia bacterium]